MSHKYEVFLLLVLSIVPVVALACGGDGGDGSTREGEPQVVEAKKGDLSITVWASGNLRFGETATFTFGSSGRVEELNVSVGDSVDKGQVLARLDLSALEASVTQAAANLKNAEDALQNALDPYSEGDIAKIRAAVASAEASLGSAQKALEEALHPNSEGDIAKARAAVASAEVSVSDAEQALEDARNPSSKEALREIENARALVRNARVAADNAQRDLSLAEADWSDALKDVTGKRDDARDEYEGVLQRYLGLKLTEAQLSMEPAALLAELGIDLASIFDPMSVVSFEDDPSTPWSEPIVFAWKRLSPSSPPSPDKIMDQVDAAWESLVLAREKLGSIETQAAKAISNSENSLAKAQEALAQAEDDLADLLDGPDTDTVKARESQLAGAQASLLKAREDLEGVLDGPDETEVLQKQSQVESAQASLDSAREKLERATIVAPFDGIVGAVNVEEGQEVGASAQALTVVNPATIEMQALVDEIDIAQVQVGQAALITLDALLALSLRGEVASISPVARVQQGVVSYDLTISVDPRFSRGLKEGMTALADIQVLQKQGVLLVPVRALKRQEKQLYVDVVVDGKTEARNVTTGSSDGRFVEIVEGLNEGDQVLVEAASSSSGTQPIFQGQFPIGERLPGGGMFRGR